MYIPTPKWYKAYACELVFGTIMFYLTATTVAHYGGSAAFSANAALVGFVNAAIWLAYSALIPYGHFNPLITTGWIAHDLLGAMRKKKQRGRNMLNVLMYLGHYVLQIVAGILAALLTWVSADRDGPVHLGIPRVLESDDGRAAGLMVILSTIFVFFWFITAERATPMYRFFTQAVRKSAPVEKDKKKEISTHNLLVLAAEGQIGLAMAGLFRAFIFAFVVLGITFVGQPKVGWSVNPALWLGYAIVSGHYSNAWILVAMPFAGCIIGFVLYMVMRVLMYWEMESLHRMVLRKVL